jgi:hypothetical protein
MHGSISVRDTLEHELVLTLAKCFETRSHCGAAAVAQKCALPQCCCTAGLALERFEAILN